VHRVTDLGTRELGRWLGSLLTRRVLELQLSGRLTIPDAHRAIERASAGAISPSDFVPSPLASPLCFSMCPGRVEGGLFVPLARTQPKSAVFALLQEGLYPRDPGLRTLVLHALMDAESFDVSRIMRCSVAVKDGEKSIPLCAYEVLYRDGDPHLERAARPRSTSLPVI
jgi:hypothetical protein